jgi:hypothetical protein
MASQQISTDVTISCERMVGGLAGCRHVRGWFGLEYAAILDVPDAWGDVKIGAYIASLP